MAGRRDAATLDRIAYWDAGAAPYRWTETLIEWAHVRSPLAAGEQRRAFALVTVAMHDAMIAAWDAKYAYNRPRPTEQDASLTAAVAVPRSPSYPSEHAAAASAAAAVLGYLFPTDAEGFAGMAEAAGALRRPGGVPRAARRRRCRAPSPPGQRAGRSPYPRRPARCACRPGRRCSTPGPPAAGAAPWPRRPR
jgi:hypothetical protein